MTLTQDQAKIVVQILSALRYKPQDGKIVSEIITEVEKSIIDKTLGNPTVTISPASINIDIEKKAK